MAIRMIRGEARTTIQRPVAVVFEWLTDPDRLPQWMTGLLESRPEGPAEVRVGARSVEKVAVRGKTIVMTVEIIELEHGRVIGSRIETPDGPATSRFVLDDLGDACGLAHTLTAEVSGYRWVPAFVIASGITRQLRRDLARLKRQAEQTP